MLVPPTAAPLAIEIVHLVRETMPLIIDSAVATAPITVPALVGVLLALIGLLRQRGRRASVVAYLRAARPGTRLQERDPDGSLIELVVPPEQSGDSE